MNEIEVKKVWEMTFGQLVLVCTETPEHKTNLATVGWWTLLSYNPGMVSFAMAKTSYSGEMVRRTGKVVLVVPGSELSKEVISCGTTSGRDTDKVDKFGIDLKNIPGSEIQVPKNSRVVINANLQQTVEVGDHYLYICTVEKCYADDNEQPLILGK